MMFYSLMKNDPQGAPLVASTPSLTREVRKSSNGLPAVLMISGAAGERKPVKRNRHGLIQDCNFPTGRVRVENVISATRSVRIEKLSSQDLHQYQKLAAWSLITLGMGNALGPGRRYRPCALNLSPSEPIGPGHDSYVFLFSRSLVACRSEFVSMAK